MSSKGTRRVVRSWTLPHFEVRLFTTGLLQAVRTDLHSKAGYAYKQGLGRKVASVEGLGSRILEDLDILVEGLTDLHRPGMEAALLRPHTITYRPTKHDRVWEDLRDFPGLSPAELVASLTYFTSLPEVPTRDEVWGRLRHRPKLSRPNNADAYRDYLSPSFESYATERFFTRPSHLKTDRRAFALELARFLSSQGNETLDDFRAHDLDPYSFGHMTGEKFIALEASVRRLPSTRGLEGLTRDEVRLLLDRLPSTSSGRALAWTAKRVREGKYGASENILISTLTMEEEEVFASIRFFNKSLYYLASTRLEEVLKILFVEMGEDRFRAFLDEFQSPVNLLALDNGKSRRDLYRLLDEDLAHIPIHFALSLAGLSR